MKNIIIVVLTGIVLVAAGFLILQDNATPAVQDVQTPDSGSVTSAEVPGNVFSVGQRVQWEYHNQMRPNASTTCSFVSPGSTSTLSSLTAQVASSSSVANILEFATSLVSSFATTTLIGTTYNIAAASPASIVASTTLLNGSPLLGPNTRVNVKVGQYGSSGARGYPVGTCNAVFTVL